MSLFLSGKEEDIFVSFITAEYAESDDGGHIVLKYKKSQFLKRKFVYVVCLHNRLKLSVFLNIILNGENTKVVFLAYNEHTLG